MGEEHHGRKGCRSKYREPVRKFANDKIKIKLFCHKPRCNNYINGIEGYNGAFFAEDGGYADLRNQVWYCDKHKPKENKSET